MSPLLAQSGHASAAHQCLLLGVKRTSGEGALFVALEQRPRGISHLLAWEG